MANHINGQRLVSLETLRAYLEKTIKGLRAEFRGLITARNEASSGQPTPAEPVLHQFASEGHPVTGREAVHGEAQGLSVGAASTRGQQTPAADQRQGASSGFLGANPMSTPLDLGFSGGNQTSPTTSSRHHLGRWRTRAEDQQGEVHPRKRVASGINGVNRTGNNNNN